jgi:TRAP-type C4-dicarboxylate transport system substrate-binding protein
MLARRPTIIRLPLRLACSTALLAAIAAGCGGSPGDKAGGAARAKATVLELANHDNGPRDVGPFMAAVRRLSRGTLDIQVRSRVHQEDVDYERAIIDDVRAGRYALGKVGARAWDLAGVDSFAPLVAPFAITSLEQQERVLLSPLARDMLAGVERLGLHGVAILPGELRYPVGVSRDALARADFRDAVVGIRPSGVADATFEALGGRARPVVAGAAYTGLDIVEQDVETLSGAAGLADARSVTANLPLWPRTQTIVMGKAAYDRLTGQQRDALARAAVEAIGPSTRSIAESNANALALLCRREGFALLATAPEAAEDIRRAAEPVLANLRRDSAAADALDAIDSLRAGSDTLQCGDAPAPAPIEPVATPVDGTWKADVTRKAYFDAGPDEGEDHEANWGPHTMVLRRGRFTIENARFAGGVARGSYAVRADQLLMRPEDEPGTWRYRWSRYRGTLRLRGGSTAGPTALRALPWIEVR